jgi:hypothetical protein
VRRQLARALSILNSGGEEARVVGGAARNALMGLLCPPSLLMARGPWPRGGAERNPFQTLARCQVAAPREPNGRSGLTHGAPRREGGATLLEARLPEGCGRISYKLPPRNNISVYRRLFVGIERPYLHALPKGEQYASGEDHSQSNEGKSWPS